MAEKKGKKGFFGRLVDRFRGGEDQDVAEVEVPEVAPAEPEARQQKAPEKPPAKKRPAEKKTPTKKAPVKKPKAEKPAEPKPKITEKAAPKPKSKPKAKPKPVKKAEPTPAPKPEREAKTEPKPAPASRPEVEPEPEPKPDPVVEAKVTELPPADIGAPPPAPVEPPPSQPDPVPQPAREPEQEPEPIPESEPDSTPETEPEEPPKKKGWFARLKSGLSRSSNQLKENITAVFTKRKLDDDTLQDLEDVLIQADLGVETAMNITEALAKDRYNKEIDDREVREILSAEVEKVLEPVATPLEIPGTNKPHVILVVGVNGTGKTTTIGKLAAKFRDEGKSVMLAAGDTFRAAAIDQLKIWGERVGAPVIAREEGADSSGLAYDAITTAREQNIDVLMIDTAGRLQNQNALMGELEKLVRVIGKQDETAPHDVLLVLDATTGQNALQQVEIFKNVARVSGLVMTKLDGTARGGILVAISAKYRLPVHAIGVGETLEDLQPFDAAQFASAIAGMDDQAA